MKDKCYICNKKLLAAQQETVSISQVSQDCDNSSLMESNTIASFCAQCLWDHCDSKLKHFKDRDGTTCLYCAKKVSFDKKHFYFFWERSFDVVSSQLIHGKCYNENVGIYQKREVKIKKNWGTTFSNLAFPIVRKVFPTLVAHDILSVQPMTMPSSLLDYLNKSLPPQPDSLIVSPETYKLLEDLEKDKKV
jgi:hypothetical protein